MFKKIDTIPDDVIADPETCFFCTGSIHSSLELWPKLSSDLQSIEFSSFMVGVHTNISSRQEEIFQNFGLIVTPLKQEVSNIFTNFISRDYSKEVNQSEPDITIIINLDHLSYDIQIKSIYLLGKYKKLIRGIPQTKWPCTHCKGKGCVRCNETGQQYAHSVENLIAGAAHTYTVATTSSFHGAGREDIDALMLGTGRPFVLEIKNPKIRTIDLESLSNEINISEYIEISDLQYTTKSTIKKIKSESSTSRKVYRATIELADGALLSKLDFLSLSPVTLDQQTPTRVTHRRADIIRKKTIFKVVVVEMMDDRHCILEIEAQGGAYIKEFISGDNGRTIPSISSILNVQATCTALDVIKVDDKGIF
ncbi:MAG: tRNA pseudouridine(54/55) synthase Pus10 [Candidatus Heimdallarchaeota archaeon]|nr:tRNA pseudouridine(54/55) synthase Pus10 [Candidatus Heimdallarchaeota archaeon]